MAEIDDALPNTPVSDEAFVEQEVAIPGQDLPKDPQKPEVIMDEMGGAEISFDPRKENLESDTHFQNLAEVIDEQDLDFHLPVFVFVFTKMKMSISKERPVILFSRTKM